MSHYENIQKKDQKSSIDDDPSKILVKQIYKNKYCRKGEVRKKINEVKDESASQKNALLLNDYLRKEYLNNNTSYVTIPKQRIDILLAHRSENSEHYSVCVRGYQDIAMCITVFLMDKLLPLCIWNRIILTGVMDTGNELYKENYVAYHFDDTQFRRGNLIRRIQINGIKAKIVINSMVVGARFDVNSITVSIKMCFNLKQFCILSVDEKCVAIFHKENGYYLFDPNDLNMQGERVESGCAGVLLFPTLNSLVALVYRNIIAANPRAMFFTLLIIQVKEFYKIDKDSVFEMLKTDVLTQMVEGKKLKIKSSIVIDSIF